MNTLFINVGLGSISLFLLATIVVAEESRIYQTDSTGNIQYHKPSAVLQENGRIIETDPYGNKQYHQQQYQIKGERIYQTDKFGNIQYHKPHGLIKK